MASTIRTEELNTFRQILERLAARLKGDLDQMTDEALKRNHPEASSNLSNMPLHMADLGTENYDQEFTLSLIENEQATLDQIEEALRRLDGGRYGECEECGHGIAKARLQALPYTKHCIECARRLENA
jgi:DnaK suppressor protein